MAVLAAHLREVVQVGGRGEVPAGVEVPPAAAAHERRQYDARPSQPQELSLPEASQAVPNRVALESEARERREGSARDRDDGCMQRPWVSSSVTSARPTLSVTALRPCAGRSLGGWCIK